MLYVFSPFLRNTFEKYAHTVLRFQGVPFTVYTYKEFILQGLSFW
jgi:hypothetical protein